jgi:DNA repair protein RadC
MQTEFKSLVGEIQVDYLPKCQPKKKIADSKCAESVLRPLFSRINYREQFIAYFTNRQNNTIGYCIVSEGGHNGTLVDIKLLMQHALLCHASGMVVAHNHPSGALRASSQDIALTGTLKKACDLFNISLLDHLIITKDSYMSMADQRLLPS